mmetsp:Transcript_21901/g.51753  ORF Transcript_21901/g.51753 Transcript_21901/m.51753 type:complete len:290 (-) Transcript_21901:227-1096(-)
MSLIQSSSGAGGAAAALPSFPLLSALANWAARLPMAPVSAPARPLFISPTRPPPLRFSMWLLIICSTNMKPSMSPARSFSPDSASTALGRNASLLCPIVATAFTAAAASPMSSVTASASHSTSSARSHPGYPCAVSPPPICPSDDTVAILVTGSGMSRIAFFMPSSADCGKSGSSSGFFSATAPIAFEQLARTSRSSVASSSSISGGSTFTPIMPSACTAARRSCTSSSTSSFIKRAITSSPLPSLSWSSAIFMLAMERIEDRLSLSVSNHSSRLFSLASNALNPSGTS